jgi:hypothetical protein
MTCDYVPLILSTTKMTKRIELRNSSETIPMELGKNLDKKKQDKY